LLHHRLWIPERTFQNSKNAKDGGASFPSPAPTQIAPPEPDGAPKTLGFAKNAAMRGVRLEKWIALMGIAAA